MIAWAKGVNKKVYGLNITQSNNFTEVTFESGLKRRYLNDFRAYKQYSFKITLNDSPNDSQSEYKKFLNWYENTLMSGALSFSFIDFDDIKKTKEYFFAQAPTVQGQALKEVSISLQEA
ncbi:hypothetical protein [Treponema pectinovorum]|uniref:hypothetical protein n=1 Tax=Treponema pectinovorum TaxID=164 RepID=UPI0011CA3394|nr:hypothetical protein [Treponema pectinovorum]